MSEPRFALGRLVATPGALQEIAQNGKQAAEFIVRHTEGDWGDLDTDDRAANETAIADGSRIFSAYQLTESTRIYVITEADRTSTTILLAEEY